MKKTSSFLKRNIAEIFLSAVASFLLYFLCPSGLSGILFALLSLLLSILFLVLSDKQKEGLEKRLSAYSYLSQFAIGIDQGLGSKTSYDNACRYLVSYQSFPDYESEKEEPSIQTYEFKDSYLFLWEKDKSDEIHLLNLRPLIEEVDKKSDRLEKRLSSLKKKHQQAEICLLFLMFLSEAILALFPAFSSFRSFSEDSSLRLVQLILLFLLSLSFPLAEASALFSLREVNGDERKDKR